MTSFAVVGSGWRAEMFWRLAAALPDVECLGAVVRTPRELPVPTFTALDEIRPDFVVTAVPWPANPSVIVEAVDRGLPVLAETPPAPDADGLAELWQRTGQTGLVQVAEQYLLVPAHAARLAAVRAGVVGKPTQVQVSSTHMYHAVSLMRGFLGAGRGPVTVRATRTTAPLVDPLTRDGWTDDPEPKPATTTIATIDFDDGLSGLYDFTDNQWHNQLRFRRIVVRGTHGELRDDEVVRLTEPRTVVRSPLTRRQTGYDLDLDDFDTDTITLGDRVLFRNPFPGRRFNDEEIAIATLLRQMADWVRGDGPPPYPLADGAHDHLVALAVEESADTDRTVTIDAPPWR
ncbi:Gfo/Idh/MocA family protein [Paractinoplanes lichenicola]|uniref:Gfo/Idh/MocA family oxidoreductase n=1 Tax=Paractinoplanes lichenicola TaxID=2802976 RepID=A0ABS1VTG5_9ACTN|nr:Gfo/Idh/MocA family oxidoreductase [Actinoplanes lichenicola]MBL7257742.1 Gfo/Idh/MocA family oxidoreductase [Actinoplanes lichenicola]